MTFRTKNNLLTLLVLIAFVGCQRKPDDVPRLFPCNITVTNGSRAIEGATVLLGPESPGIAWTASGTTDSSGNALIRTSRLNWKGDGVPAGRYRISVSKVPVHESLLPDEEVKKMTPDERERYVKKETERQRDLPREIPMEFEVFASSPFHIEIGEKTENRLTVDIAEHPIAKSKK